MHDGKLDASATVQALQAELADLVWFALRRSA